MGSKVEGPELAKLKEKKKELNKNTKEKKTTPLLP